MVFNQLRFSSKNLSQKIVKSSEFNNFANRWVSNRAGSAQYRSQSCHKLVFSCRNRYQHDALSKCHFMNHFTVNVFTGQRTAMDLRDYPLFTPGNPNSGGCTFATNTGRDLSQNHGFCMRGINFAGLCVDVKLGRDPWDPELRILVFLHTVLVCWVNEEDHIQKAIGYCR